MWDYAVSLFLVTIDCNSLLLPAIYGLVRALTVVLFGTLVGDWVDANPRRKGEILARQKEKPRVFSAR